MKKLITLILILICNYSYSQNTYLQVHETQRSINRNTAARNTGTHSNIDTVCISPIPSLALKQWAVYGNNEDSTKIFFMNGKSCWIRTWNGSTYTFTKPTYPLNR